MSISFRVAASSFLLPNTLMISARKRCLRGTVVELAEVRMDMVSPILRDRRERISLGWFHRARSVTSHWSTSGPPILTMADSVLTFSSREVTLDRALAATPRRRLWRGSESNADRAS
jgi:hypothetical protein